MFWVVLCWSSSFQLPDSSCDGIRVGSLSVSRCHKTNMKLIILGMKLMLVKVEITFLLLSSGHSLWLT